MDEKEELKQLEDMFDRLKPLSFRDQCAMAAMQGYLAQPDGFSSQTSLVNAAWLIAGMMDEKRKESQCAPT